MVARAVRRGRGGWRAGGSGVGQTGEAEQKVGSGEADALAAEVEDLGGCGELALVVLDGEERGPEPRTGCGGFGEGLLEEVDDFGEGGGGGESGCGGDRAGEVGEALLGFGLEEPEGELREGDVVGRGDLGEGLISGGDGGKEGVGKRVVVDRGGGGRWRGGWGGGGSGRCRRSGEGRPRRAGLEGDGREGGHDWV